jgi:hypothetical protein
MSRDDNLRCEACQRDCNKKVERKERKRDDDEGKRKELLQSGTGPAVGSLEKRQISLVYITLFYLIN